MIEKKIPLKCSLDFLKYYPSELISFLEIKDSKSVSNFLQSIPPVEAVKLLSELNPETGSQILKKLPVDVKKKLLPAMVPERLCLFVSRLEKKQRAEVIELLPKALAKEVQEFTSYSPDSSGYFRTSFIGILKYYLTASRPEKEKLLNEVEREWYHQIKKIKDTVQELVDKGATSVEQIHKSIAEIPFKHAEAIAPEKVKPYVEPVKEFQDTTVGVVYDVIRKINLQRRGSPERTDRDSLSLQYIDEFTP